MLAGFVAISPVSGRELYSAQAPRRRPVFAKTWSPFLNSRTALPTDSTSPASSCPSIFFLGLLNPNPIRTKSFHNRGSLRLRSSQSPFCYRCRVDSDQYFIVLWSRFLHFFELKYVRGPVSCAYNRFHEFPPKCLVRSMPL